MMWIRRLLRTTILALFFLPLADASSKDHQPLDVASVDRFVIEHLERTHIPGVVVVVTGRDSVEFLKGYGLDSNKAPMSPDTPMYIASLSKSFTALAVMQLVEAGRIDLDQPVSRYLPDFILHDSRAALITVRQLLNQSSGMSDATFFEWTTNGPDSLTDAVARLRASKLDADPGTKHIYHNPNYHVAARVVEKVSGEPFAEYMQRHVFGPLGMNNTRTIDRLDERAQGVALGHIYAFGQPIAVHQPAYFVNGAAGVISTANDMAKWLIAQSKEGVGPNGTRILSAAGIQAMHSPSAPGGSYGLGWQMDLKDRSHGLWHAGKLATFSAYQSVSHDQHSGIAVLSNGVVPFGTCYEPICIADGIAEIEQGRAARSYGEDTFALDVVLGLCAIASLLMGSLLTARSTHWAAARANSAKSIALRLAPYLFLLMLVAAVPIIAGYKFDRAVSWLLLAYASPMLVCLCACLTVCACAVLVSRGIALVKSKS